MPKISDLPDFHSIPHHSTMDLRFNDQDILGHVNNIVFASAYEHGRVAFLFNDKNNIPPKDTQFVIVQIEINYLAEMHFPGEIEIATAITRFGTSSIQLYQMLRHKGKITSTATSTIVLTNKNTNKSTPITQPMREYLLAFSLNERAQL